MQVLVDRTKGRAFRWRFRSIPELRKALEEYTAMVDLELQRKSKGDSGDPDPAEMDTLYRVGAQNKEIDRKLAVLVLEAPTYARLLHHYYRQGSKWLEPDGWRIAAKRAGIPSRGRTYRGEDMGRRHFDTVLDLALRELFHSQPKRVGANESGDAR